MTDTQHSIWKKWRSGKLGEDHHQVGGNGGTLKIKSEAGAIYWFGFVCVNSALLLLHFWNDIQYLSWCRATCYPMIIHLQSHKSFWAPISLQNQVRSRNLRARHTVIHQVCFWWGFFGFFFDRVYKLIKVSALFAASDTKRGRREFLPLPNNINSFRVIKPPTCWVFTSINHPRVLVAVDVMDGWEGVCGGGLRREKP